MMINKLNMKIIKKKKINIIIKAHQKHQVIQIVYHKVQILIMKIYRKYQH
jgi:hypothetical protein